MLYRPGKLVFPDIRSFQNPQHLGAGTGQAAKPPLSVLSFRCHNHKGKRDPTQPLPSAHIQSESTHSAADSQFPYSIFRVPGPTLPSHTTSQLELQPQWPLSFPQPHYRTKSREKIALLCLCERSLLTLLLRLFNRLRLPHWPSLLSVSSVPPALPYPDASPHSHHKHQPKPLANSAAS